MPVNAPRRAAALLGVLLAWWLPGTAAADSTLQAGIAQAESRARNGDSGAALGLLQALLAEGGENPSARAAILASRAGVHLAGGRTEEAGTDADAALALAREHQLAALMPLALSHRAGVLARTRKLREALATYEEAERLAEAEGNPLLAATAGLGAAREALRLPDPTAANAALQRVAAVLPRIPEAQARGFQLLVYARTLRQLPTPQPNPSAEEHAALKAALALADETRSGLLRTYALGYLGDAYQASGRTAEALRLYREALLAAQGNALSEPAFLWHWRLGRLAGRRGALDDAIAEYRAATSLLAPIRAALSQRYAGQALEPSDNHAAVYTELADLLLRKAPQEHDPARRQAALLDARDVLEKLKSAELEDYFQDQCVSALQARTHGIDAIDDKTAVIYPVVLPDRLEILLSTRGSMVQFTTPTSREDVQALVVKFRRALEKRTTREYLRYAVPLHKLLLEPLAAKLRADGVEMLVFVPDDVFRMIPLAALHDGKAFLIERYGVAVTPGLTITDPTPLQLRSASLLAGGITQGVQGFGALPNVTEELAAVGAAYPGTALINEAFEPDALREALLKQPYRILHLATHGEFGADARDNFILTWSRRITLPELQGLMGATKFRSEPVDILTLSACNTAAGDARAALGLAGVAVQSGARSALATLWYVNDTASSLLVQTFYRQLGQSAISKGQALRQAQLTLLAEPRFRHPGYWSPFLLIGNWI